MDDVKVRLAALVCSPLLLAITAAAAWGAQPIGHGLHDLVIFDPGAHERGLPAVELQPTEDGEGVFVDIPPVMHVHRYYYSGNKEYQGPFIQGGPTVVVANHPKTGERMYVDVMLPSGAPKIAYDSQGITYVYPDRRVSVRFSRFGVMSNRAHIKIKSGRGVSRHVREWKDEHIDTTRQQVRESELFGSLQESWQGSRDLLVGGAAATGSAASRILDGARGLLDSLPGASAIKSQADQNPRQRRDASLRNAGRRNDRNATTFLPTNR